MRDLVRSWTVLRACWTGRRLAQRCERCARAEPVCGSAWSSSGVELLGCAILCHIEEHVCSEQTNLRRTSAREINKLLATALRHGSPKSLISASRWSFTTYVLCSDILVGRIVPLAHQSAIIVPSMIAIPGPPYEQIFTKRPQRKNIRNLYWDLRTSSS